MKKGITTLIITAALGFASGDKGVHAFGSGSKGTSGAQFLELDPSARAAGMGDCFGGVADDVYATYFNPAGLGFLKKVELAGMHDQYFQGLSHNFGAVSVPLLSWVDTREERNAYGVLAFSLTSLSVDGIQRRGLTETDAPSDTFGSSDFAYALSYGYMVTDSLSLGLTAKAIDLTLDTAHASAFGTDAGLLYKREKVSVGLGWRNLGNKVKYVAVGDPIPFAAYLGGGYRPTPNWLLAAEADLPRDNSATYAFGVEYRKHFTEDISGALRGGYNSANRDADGLTGLSLGAGLGFRNFSFDFGWVPFGELGNTFRYALVVKF